jgi:predicted Zn-dependent protease
VLRLAEQGPEFSDFTDHERIVISDQLMDEGSFARAAGLLEHTGLLVKDAPRLTVVAARARLGAHQPALAAHDCVVAWHGGRRGAALEQLAVALLLDPGMRVGDPELEARARALGAVDSAGSAGRYDEALQRSAAALARWPGEPLFLRRQAMGWLALGRPDAALEAARAAVAADSGDAGGWSDLARVYEQLGQAGPARAAHARGVKEQEPPP